MLLVSAVGFARDRRSIVAHMTGQTLNDHWLAADVRRRLAAFVAQLRSGVDGGAKVPNLAWTVSELGAHVASLPGFYDVQHQAGEHFEQPDDFDAMSTNARSHITETEVGAVADRLEAEYHRFFEEYGQLPAQTDRWFYGRRTTLLSLCAMFVNELILHGRDLAAVTGAEMPKLNRQQANAIADATMIITPSFVDKDKARQQPNGVYGVSFRGGNDYTWRLADGDLSITKGKPAKADARLNADPVTFMMTSMGRMSDARAALSGGMMAYGRKPWRLAGLGKIVADGV